MKPKYYIQTILILLGFLFLPKLAFAALLTSSSGSTALKIFLIILIEVFVFWLLAKKLFRAQIKFSKILLATLTGFFLFWLLWIIFLLPLSINFLHGSDDFISRALAMGCVFIPYMFIKVAIYRLFLRKTDIGKSNRSKISFIVNSNLIVIVLLIILFFSAYRPGIKGEIIDAATKEPLEGIKIEREITFKACHFECSTYTAASPSTRTDKNGVFKFWPKIIFKLPGDFYQESFRVNRDSTRTGGKIVYIPDNIEYYYEYYYPDGHGFSPKYEKKHIIELIPFVDSKEECNSNEDCIQYNSFRIAVKNKDANACLTYDRPDVCLKVIALLKEDTSICNLCDVIKISEEYKFREDKEKRWCKEECLSCFGTIYGKEKNICSKEGVCSAFDVTLRSGTKEKELCLSLFE